MGLRRFGLPEHVLNVIAPIYKDRTFQLRDCGQFSSTRQQHSGISQGCPLSPFLFVMMMSVLMKDAVARLGARDQELLNTGRLAELLYADDTLLLGVCFRKQLRQFLGCCQCRRWQIWTGITLGEITAHADKVR